MQIGKTTRRIQIFGMWLYSCVLIHSCTRTSQGQKEMNAGELHLDLVIVDTITIKDPIVLKFGEIRKDRGFRSGFVLIIRSDLEMIGDSINFQSYVLNNGFLFYTPNMFYCILDNFIHNSGALLDDSYIQLREQIRNREKDTIWKPVINLENTIERYSERSEHEITTKKFILCLVSGGALQDCRGLSQLAPENNDNVYFKVLIPCTFHGKTQ